MGETFSGSFKQLVAMFLAEVVRSRRTSLARAAEISDRVIQLLPDMKTEAEALSLLTEVEKEFEEMVVLKQALHFGYKENDVQVYEHDIKDYAAEIFSKDMSLSVAFLHDAARPGMDIQKLCLKYPDFCDYLMRDPNNLPVYDHLKLRPA
ncbi:MAG: hypothetical protein M1333_00085 [Patescibacteria group bacterium]|nr:hypothetical protein [Patescibacteria group bacterium]